MRMPLPDAPLQRGEARPLSLPLHFHGSTAWRGSVHASRRSGGEEACSRAFAMLPVLDAVESGLRGDAEHRKGLRGAMAGRSTPRVPLSPIYNVRSSVLRRLATLPRFKTRLLWTSDVVFKLFALRHSNAVSTLGRNERKERLSATHSSVHFWSSTRGGAKQNVHSNVWLTGSSLTGIRPGLD